ncbi:MAG: glycosyltransferase [Candidatus Aminicenantes bacterium]|nr:MAG: glycosyltransferase [Candidatus Aminicenantes bacterium]
MVKALLAFFLLGSTLLWFSIFGYILIIGLIVLKKRRHEQNEISLPEIAIVIPTLNEENLILPKLTNLREIDYPLDKVKIFVIDGGSNDRTAKLVRHETAHNKDIQLLCLNHARAKPDQINYALSNLEQDIVLFTDADSELEPSCIRELVNALIQDPRAAVIGAFVLPDSTLLEERVYWWFLMNLWWLEGEAMSAANISGACYACRRELVQPLPLDVYSDDINIALAANARGHRVRICRKAEAKEIRVPQTVTDFMRFRRYRGAGYKKELVRSKQYTQAPLSWRLVRRIRLWHFSWTPVLVFSLAVSALVLFWTPFWQLSVFILLAFSVPIFVVPFVSKTLKNYSKQLWRLGLASGRLIILIFLSLLTLNIFPSREPSMEKNHGP